MALRAALLLVLLLTLGACGDDSDGGDGDAPDATNGDGDGAGGAGDGDGDTDDDTQEGGAVATDEDEPMDISEPEPDAGAGPPPVDEPKVDELEPDSAFDFETCKDVTFDRALPEDDQVPRCAECCSLRAYTLARFVFEETCACTERPSFEDTEVCDAETGDAEACTTCCQDAGFEAGDHAADSCRCTRAPINDTEVCNDTLEADEPVLACEACCLEAGLFGFMHSDTNAVHECRCIEPG